MVPRGCNAPKSHRRSQPLMRPGVFMVPGNLGLSLRLSKPVELTENTALKKPEIAPDASRVPGPPRPPNY